MTEIIKHKSGRTFELVLEIEPVEGEADINNTWAGKCQIREGNDTLVDEAEFTWLGEREFQLRVVDTSAWCPVTQRQHKLWFDVLFSAPGGDHHEQTPSLVIDVERGITRNES